MVIKRTLESLIAELDAKGTRRRDIAWKDDNTPQQYDEGNSNHRTAVVFYLTGVEVPTIAACIKCLMNNGGPMKECVISLDHSGRYKPQRGCTNCRWKGGADSCTFNTMKPCTLLRMLGEPLGKFAKACLKSCNNNCLPPLDPRVPSAYLGAHAPSYPPRFRPPGPVIRLPPPCPPHRPLVRPVTLLPYPFALPPLNLEPVARSQTGSQTTQDTLPPPTTEHDERQVGDVTVPVGYLENLSATRAREISANTITAEVPAAAFEEPYTAEDIDRINLRMLCLAADHIETFGVMDPRLLM